MALERQAYLYHTPAQQDEADCPNQGKDEGGKVVDRSQRVAGRHGRQRKTEMADCRTVQNQASADRSG